MIDLENETIMETTWRTSILRSILTKGKTMSYKWVEMAKDCFRIPFVITALLLGRQAGPGSKVGNRIELGKSRGSRFTYPCEMFVPRTGNSLVFFYGLGTRELWKCCLDLRRLLLLYF